MDMHVVLLLVRQERKKEPKSGRGLDKQWRKHEHRSLKTTVIQLLNNNSGYDSNIHRSRVNSTLTESTSFSGELEGGGGSRKHHPTGGETEASQRNSGASERGMWTIFVCLWGRCSGAVYL